MTVDYTVLDPTGNITLLVTTPVPVPEQPLTAKKLMELEPAAEQVGFVSDPAGSSIRLRMAGGEFCGNAAMSAAALCTVLKKEKHSLPSPDKDNSITVYVSGTEEPVHVAAMAIPGFPGEEAAWKGTVTMPGPVTVGEELLPFGPENILLPVVRIPGITHIIVNDGSVKIGKSDAEFLARRWCSCLQAEALGVLFLDIGNGTMEPFVYVPAADTVFWESSCASGTTAAGAYLAAAQGKPVSLSLNQPGGTLSISVQQDGRMLLSGSVRMVSRGTVIF